MMNMMLVCNPLNYAEAQNLTDATPREVKTLTPLFCDQDMIGNSNASSSDPANFSLDEAVVDIRCHLQEARNAIAAGAADSALLQINEAEETLLISRDSGTDAHYIINIE